MRILTRSLAALLFMAALAVPTFVTTGCSAHVSTGYRVYDPYYSDYHVWDNGEAGYYSRWETETHRNHVDFRHRPPAEQKEYWTWRHGQH